MAENKELKPKSFRIDEETSEKIKQIAAELGGNQNQALVKLIQTYEMQAGKAILAEKQSEIEEFERYITAITRKYMGSLEDNQNLSETIRAEYDAQLKSKDRTIQDLQDQLTAARQLKEEAVTKAKAHADENIQLHDEINRLDAEYHSKVEDLQTMLEDKDSLNKALTDSCNTLKSKAESMKDAADQSEALRSELAQLRKEHENILKEHSDLENRLQREQAAHEEALNLAREQQQLALDKAVLESERTYQKQMQDLKAVHQEEIDKYQQKYLSLLEQMQNQAGASE